MYMNVNILICTIMKRLNKLQINPERLMKNEDLVTLRGGYDEAWVFCYIESTQCGNNPIVSCDGSEPGSARWFCDTYCPEWTNLVCVGG
jgi:hypothetical protein